MASDDVGVSGADIVLESHADYKIVIDRGRLQELKAQIVDDVGDKMNYRKYRKILESEGIVLRVQGSALVGR